MRDSKVISAIAAVVTVGATVVMVVTLKGGLSPGIEAGPPEAAGWTMARQTVSLLQPGGQVLVISRNTAEFKNPATDIQLAAFKRELKKARVNITTEQVLDVDPLRPVEVPSGDFQEWIRKSPEGSVIVSFMGPPLLTTEQRKQLREIKPAIVVFCPGNWPERVNLPLLFKEDLLRAAIVSRRNQRSAAAKPGNAQAWFDQNYLIVTAANVGDLASSRAP